MVVWWLFLKDFLRNTVTKQPLCPAAAQLEFSGQGHLQRRQCIDKSKTLADKLVVILLLLF